MQYHRRQVGCKGLRVCVCGDIKRILKYEPFVLYIYIYKKDIFLHAHTREYFLNKLRARIRLRTRNIFVHVLFLKNFKTSHSSNLDVLFHRLHNKIYH